MKRRTRGGWSPRHGKETPPESVGEPVLLPATVKLKLAGGGAPVDYPRPSPKRRMTGAICFSLVFHLSMVTLFRIMVYFPREERQFFDFRIVQAPSLEIGEGRLARSELGLEKLRMELPGIELPTLEFSETARLRERQQSLAADAKYRELTGEARPRDSWGQFVAGMQELPQTLSRLTLSAVGESESTVAGSVSAPISFRPAEGYSATLEWGNPPLDRPLLFSPPLKSLWETGAEGVEAPLELVLEVNPAGRVVSVWNPAAGDSALADRLQAGMLKYRFGMIEGTGNQLATVRIRSGANEP